MTHWHIQSIKDFQRAMTSYFCGNLCGFLPITGCMYMTNEKIDNVCLKLVSFGIIPIDYYFESEHFESQNKKDRQISKFRKRAFIHCICESVHIELAQTILDFCSSDHHTSDLGKMSEISQMPVLQIWNVEKNEWQETKEEQVKFSWSVKHERFIRNFSRSVPPDNLGYYYAQGCFQNVLHFTIVQQDWNQERNTVFDSIEKCVTEMSRRDAESQIDSTE